MFDTIKRLYVDEGRITEAGVKKAVKKGMITQKDCDKILNMKRS